jgi:hypothetical protein
MAQHPTSTHCAERVVNKAFSPCPGPGATPLGAQVDAPAVMQPERAQAGRFYSPNGGKSGIMLHYTNYVTSPEGGVSPRAKALEQAREGGGGSLFSMVGTPLPVKTRGVGSIRGAPAHSRANFFQAHPVLAVLGVAGVVLALVGFLGGTVWAQ